MKTIQNIISNAVKTPIVYSAVLLCSLSLALMSCGTDAGEEDTNFMEVVSMNPGSPADLSFGDFVFITFEYSIANSEGARMWVIPYTGGSASPAYSYSSSTVFHGEGSRTVRISVTGGSETVTVDQLNVKMVTPDQSQTLYEKFTGVEFNFNE